MDVNGIAPGNFNWADLATTDAEAAKRFYTEIFGWTYEDLPMGEGQTYSMCLANGRQACALHGMTMGQPPHWGVYIATSSSDESAARAKELGGSVLMDPFDVFDSVRMAVVQDPTGAVFSVAQPLKHQGIQVVDEKGAMVWNELNTRDTATAEEFYTGLFGWRVKKSEGPMEYAEFQSAGKSVAGMMAIQPEWGPDVPPHWLIYFGTDDTDATAAKTAELGGKVLAGPMSIPSGGRFAVLMDPQGAVFGVYK